MRLGSANPPVRLVSVCQNNDIEGYGFIFLFLSFFSIGHRAAGPIHGVVVSNHNNVMREPLLDGGLVGASWFSPPPSLSWEEAR